MPLERSIVGAINGHVFAARLPADRPLEDYTPRVVPWHEAAVVPLEAPLVAWGPRPLASAPAAVEPDAVVA